MTLPVSWFVLQRKCTLLPLYVWFFVPFLPRALMATQEMQETKVKEEMKA